MCLNFCFADKFICTIFLDSTYMQYYMIFAFLWHTSLCMTVSRSIHVSANGIVFIPFYGWVIFHFVCVCVCVCVCVYVCIHIHIYHIFFIHSSVEGNLGCFHVLALVNNAAVNIGMHVSFWIMVFSGKCLEVGLLGHRVVLFLVFKRTSILFSIIAKLI